MSTNIDLSRYSTIIPTERIPALTRDLRKVPDFSWLLDKPHPELERLQGDVVAGCPTVFLDQKGQPQCRNFPVMVLNNSCDLPNERIDPVTVAPLVDFHDFAESIKKSKSDESMIGYIDRVRRNEVTELFYLPRFDGFPNGAIAFLHMVCSVSAVIYRDLVGAESRRASFTQTGFYFCLIKLIQHFARPESDEVARA